MKFLSNFQRRLSIFHGGESESTENLDTDTKSNGSRSSNTDYENDNVEENKKKGNKPKIVLRDYTPLSYTILFVACVSIAGIVFPLCFMLYYSLVIEGDHVGICVLEENKMFDCFPNVTDVNDQLCDSWGCCWLPATEETSSRCYHRYPSSYVLTTCEEETNLTYTNLTIAEEKCTHREGLGPLNGLDSDYGNKKFVILTEALSKDHLRIRVCPKSSSKSSPESSSDCQLSQKNTLHDDTQFVVSNTKYSGNNFVITVIRRNSFANNSIFTINYKGGMLQSEKYTEVTIVLQNNSQIYGLGFNTHSTFHRPFKLNSWTMINNYSDFSPGSSLSGFHPMYLCHEVNHFAHGVLFNNNHVMNVELHPYPAITFRALGGPIDFHIVLGPKPVDVIKQFSEIDVIGKPVMPSYWALGFHMCRTLDDSMEKENDKNSGNIFQEMWEKGIPQESDCIDGDAWKYLNFDKNNKRLDNFSTKANILRNRGQKILAVSFPQFPSEMSTESKYIFESGRQSGVFVKNTTDGIYFGTLLDLDSVAYVDVTHSDLVSWMKQNLNWNFDGFILHWNTPVDLQFKNESSCSDDPLNHPAYHLPLGDLSLSSGTLCMDSVYYNNDTHSNIHNDYGRRYMKSVFDVVESPNKRSFIISLATSTGSGHLGGAWGGEYPSTWETLRMSITSAFEASLYNIPLFGVPICGNTGSINEELCVRWFQAGVFFPLALMYYDSTDAERHPLAFSNSFGNFTIELLQTRYALLPYLYTLFHHAHVDGDPVLRPLVFEFPDEPDAREIDSQFMWGSALMFVPCLVEGVTITETWIPPGDWFDYYSGEKFFQVTHETTGQDRFVQLPSPNFLSVNLFLRGGYIIATQNSENQITTAQLRSQNFTIIVALAPNDSADGDLYLDAEEPNEPSSAYVTFKCVSSKLTISALKNGRIIEQLANKNISTTVEEVRVLGVKGDITNVTLNGSPKNYAVYSQTETETKTLRINAHFDLLETTITLSWVKAVN